MYMLNWASEGSVIKHEPEISTDLHNTLPTGSTVNLIFFFLELIYRGKLYGNKHTFLKNNTIEDFITKTKKK